MLKKIKKQLINSVRSLRHIISKKPVAEAILSLRACLWRNKVFFFRHEEDLLQIEKLKFTSIT